MAGDRAVIFDLDQTLVDSTAAEPLRRARNWRGVYAAVQNLRCYQGIPELLEQLRAVGIRIAVVTSSPQTYCSKVIKACGVQVDACVCYHDTARHKPHPDPLLLALKRLGGIDRRDAVAVGDVAADIDAARATGIYSVGAVWGCTDVTKLKAARPNHLASDVAELRAAIYDRFDLNVD
jgi:HAD superfamily hydrolase (TIGR01662 family)